MNDYFLIPKNFLEVFDSYWWYEKKYAFWHFEKISKTKDLYIADLITIYQKAKEAFPQFVPIQIDVHVPSPNFVWKRNENNLSPEQWLDNLLDSDKNKEFVFEYDGPLQIHYDYKVEVLEDTSQEINIVKGKKKSSLYVYWGEFVPNLSIEISLHGNLFEQFPYRDEKNYEIPLGAVAHNVHLMEFSLREFKKLTNTKVTDFGSEHPWGRLHVGAHGFI